MRFTPAFLTRSGTAGLALGMLLFLGSSLTRPGDAHAEAAQAPLEAPPATPPPRVSRWYGLPILATDVGGLALVVTGGEIATGREGCRAGCTSLLVLGSGSFHLGGPIVHFAHGHVARGFISLGMRTAAPVVAGFLVGGVFAAAACRKPSAEDGGVPCALSAFLVGDVLGAAATKLAASVVDIAYLAREDVPAPTANSTTSAFQTLRPNTILVRDSANNRTPTFGVAGRF
jgi:hypothetical protein